MGDTVSDKVQLCSDKVLHTEGEKKMDVLIRLTGLSITCSGLGKAAECHCGQLSDHLDAEHSFNLLVRQDVRLQKEQDREWCVKYKQLIM